MRTIAVLVLLLGLGAGGAVYYKAHASAEPANRFRTASVQRGTLLSTITATGTIEPEEVIDVGAQVMGRVRDLGIDEEAEKPVSEGAAGAGRIARPPKEKPEAIDPHRRSTKDVGSGHGEAKPPSAEKGNPAPQNGSNRPRIDYGSVVHEGTILAYIDDTKYKAQVQQAEAALARAQADLGQLEAKAVQAAAELRRAQQLRAVKPTGDPLTNVPIVAISGSDYDLAVANDKVAQANLVVAQAIIQQSRASLAQVQTDLDYTIIKSPVEGVIVDRRMNIGQTVVAALNAPSMFLIAKDLSRLQVWASVNEADIGRIRKGMSVRFSVDAFPGETFEGRVKQVRLNAQMTSNVVTYTVVVETDNPDRKLLPYLTANLKFQIETHPNVLMVPNSALRWTPQPLQIHPQFRESGSGSADKAPGKPSEEGKDAEENTAIDASAAEETGEAAAPGKKAPGEPKGDEKKGPAGKPDAAVAEKPSEPAAPGKKARGEPKGDEKNGLVGMPDGSAVEKHAHKSSGEKPAEQSGAGEDRGRVWVVVNGFVRPVDVVIGPTDGSSTGISGPEVKEGMEVVVGEDLAEPVAEDATNPFGPPRFGARKKK